MCLLAVSPGLPTDLCSEFLDLFFNTLLDYKGKTGE